MAESPPWASPDGGGAGDFGGDSAPEPAGPAVPAGSAGTEPLPGSGWDAGGQQPGWGAPPAGPSHWQTPPQWTSPGPYLPYPPSNGAGPPGSGSEGPAGGNGWGGRGPGIIPLRPLSIYDIYDGAVRAIRASPRTMVGYSAAVIAVVSLIGVAPRAEVAARLLNSPLGNPRTVPQDIQLSDLTGLIGATGLGLLVGALQLVLTTTILSGLLIVAVDGAARGRIAGPGQLWAACRGRLLGLLGLAFVVLLAAPLAVLLAMVPGIVLLFVPHAQTVGAVLIVVGAVAGLIGYVALYFGYWAVSAPALLLENAGVGTALRRSWALVRGSFWRVFGISLLSAIIVGVAKQALILPFSYLGGLVADVHGSAHFSSELVQLLISDIGTIIGGAVLYPFGAGVVALLYLDLRMRREGLDLEFLGR